MNEIAIYPSLKNKDQLHAVRGFADGLPLSSDARKLGAAYP